MVQSSDLGKATVWRQRLRGFGRAGMTVVGFCEAEGVSTASFYRWRKRLGQQRTPTSNGDQTPTFQAVRVTPANAPVSIRLPGGARIEVPTTNLDVVRTVLGELLRQDTTTGRGESRC